MQMKNIQIGNGGLLVQKAEIGNCLHGDIDNPYEYVKELQSRFDNSGIEYSDEYYDVLGIDRK